MEEDLTVWISVLVNITCPSYTSQYHLRGKQSVEAQATLLRRPGEWPACQLKCNTPEIPIPLSKLSQIINFTAVNPCPYFWLTSVAQAQAISIRRRGAGHRLRAKTPAASKAKLTARCRAPNLNRASILHQSKELEKRFFFLQSNCLRSSLV